MQSMQSYSLGLISLCTSDRSLGRLSLFRCGDIRSIQTWTACDSTYLHKWEDNAQKDNMTHAMLPF